MPSSPAAARSMQILVPAFATVREAAKRTLGQRHFDVQLVGGMVLHEGAIAEMKTGEGKTLVATLACYLNALAGKGVHVVTVNDYLARRDAEWMGRIYKFLGLSVGVIVHDLDDEQRRAAYGADITYGTNNEFGFDYLRDNMKYELAHMVQRGHVFGIVDEVELDPRRRSAHAADHLRTLRRQIRSLQLDQRAASRSSSRPITNSTRSSAPSTSPRRATNIWRSCWPASGSSTRARSTMPPMSRSCITCSRP